MKLANLFPLLTACSPAVQITQSGAWKEPHTAQSTFTLAITSHLGGGPQQCLRLLESNRKVSETG